MKILFLSHKFHPDIGGIESISEILCNAFCEAGHNVHLVTTSEKASTKKFLFTVIRRPSYVKLFKEHFWADVVFENNPCLHLSWPALFFNRPSVISIQTWVQNESGEIRWKDKFKLKWLKRASKVVACSDSIRKRCFPSSIVIQNPYNNLLFRTVDLPRTNNFVFLGRLVSDKGADLAVKALHQLVHPENGLQPLADCTLTIIGEGPEKVNLQNLVDTLKLNEHVIFAGALSGQELVAALNQHKYMLIPSTWEEPFGIVALEGMACGCIPIVSDGGGLPDAVGNAGLLFKRGNVDELVTVIKRVINNKDLENQLRNNFKMHLKSHTLTAVSQLYLKEIENAVNCKA